MLEAVLAEKTLPANISTVQAARELGFSPKWWATKCLVGEVGGAWLERGYWRFPAKSAHALILRLQQKKNKSARRGPRKKTQGAQAARTGAGSLQAERFTVLEGGSTAVGRGADLGARPEKPRMAG